VYCEYGRSTIHTKYLVGWTCGLYYLYCSNLVKKYCSCTGHRADKRNQRGGAQQLLTIRIFQTLKIKNLNKWLLLSPVLYHCVLGLWVPHGGETGMNIAHARTNFQIWLYCKMFAFVAPSYSSTYTCLPHTVHIRPAQVKPSPFVWPPTGRTKKTDWR
jgi:hypothetical protein